MMAMRKFAVMLGVVVALMSMPGSVAAQAQQSIWNKVQSSGILLAGAMVDGAPGGWKDLSTGTYHGFFINLARAIAEDLSKVMGRPIKLQFVESTWGTVVLDLQSAKIDVWAGMSATPERLKALDMAGPMYKLGGCLVNRRGLEGLKTWADYSKPEIQIAAVIGSSDEKAARELAPNATILSFRDTAQTILAVQAGRADAVINSMMTCLDIKKRNPDFGRIVFPTPHNYYPSSAGIRKDGDGRFHDFVQAWAEKNRANGTVKRLILDAVREAGLNPDELPPDMEF